MFLPHLQINSALPCFPTLALVHATSIAYSYTARPCYLRGGVCLKRGTPGCVPFRGPCREFTVCCKRKN
uniref:Uncharacterized protein n=1 Tax=Sarcophilus harrisii TaxID=9305 RepID=G3VN70_SARHA